MVRPEGGKVGVQNAFHISGFMSWGGGEGREQNRGVDDLFCLNLKGPLKLQDMFHKTEAGDWGKTRRGDWEMGG